MKRVEPGGDRAGSAFLREKAHDDQARRKETQAPKPGWGIPAWRRPCEETPVEIVCEFDKSEYFVVYILFIRNNNICRMCK